MFPDGCIVSILGPGFGGVLAQVVPNLTLFDKIYLLLVGISNFT
jgi:hypothetical protein